MKKKQFKGWVVINQKGTILCDVRGLLFQDNMPPEMHKAWELMGYKVVEAVLTYKI